LPPLLRSLPTRRSSDLALVFGLCVGSVTSGVLGLLQMLSTGAGAGGGLDSWTHLMVSLGAGIYEELLFRVLLVGAISAGARALLDRKSTRLNSSHQIIS